MDQNLLKLFCVILFVTLTSAATSTTSTAKPGITTTKLGTTPTASGNWNDLLKQLNSTLIGVTSSNINSKFRIMQEIADDACETVKLTKAVNQFQIAVYVESAVAGLADNVKDNARFYLTKVLNDVVACKA
ncbi:hypothetical protein ACKWTF_014107 [Chironomus riparius]